MNDDKVNKEQLINKIDSLESILNNVGGYIFKKDTLGRYTYVNESIAELFQCSVKEIIGKDDRHFFDLDVSNELKINDDKVINEGLIVETEEPLFVRSLGEMRVYKTVKKPIIDNDNNIVGLLGISTDISDKKALESKIADQKYLLDIILDNADAYIYMKDSNRHFRYVNNKVAELFGKPIDQIINHLDSDVLPKEFADHFWQSDKKVFETNTKQTIEESIADKNGKIKRYISTKIPYQFEDKQNVLIGLSTDITELYELKENFKKMAQTDPLTGIHNRRYFIEIAERETLRAKRYNMPFSLLTVDIDNFKAINDNYGHPAGDKVIQSVATNMLKLTRTADLLARVGGEEFSILLPNTDIEEATIAAQRYCEHQRKVKLKGDWQGEISVTISIGVTCIEKSDKTFEQLFSRADKALYQAKQTGKNKVIVL